MITNEVVSVILCFNMRHAEQLADPGQRKERDKRKEQEKEQAQTKGEKREAPGAGGGGAGGAGRQECALVAMVGCHVLTCPSVFILGELRLFVDDHASDGHVRVLLFGLLYSLGQRLTVTINTNKQNKHKPNKRFKGKNNQLNKNENSTEYTQMVGKHTCTRTTAVLDLQRPSLRL